MFLFRNGLLNLYENGFFYTSSEGLFLPPHYTEFVNSFKITYGVKIVINWGMGIMMLLKPLSKCPCRYSNVFLITCHPVTFVSVDHSPFLDGGICVLGSHLEVIDGPVTFEMSLYLMFATAVLEAFTKTFGVGHHYVCVLVPLLVLCCFWHCHLKASCACYF